MTATTPQLDAPALYALILARGCTVRVEDSDKLWVTPLTSLTQSEIAAIREMKLKLVALHEARTIADADERISEAEQLDIIGPEKLLPYLTGETVVFNFAPRGVSEAEFRASRSPQLWDSAEEDAAMGALLVRIRPQVCEVRFDQYGPMQSLRMADDLYFDLFRFRQARFARINESARRKQAIATSEDGE